MIFSVIAIEIVVFDVQNERVQTFIVGPDGIVYQKDFGPDTLKTFQNTDRYNPDKIRVLLQSSEAILRRRFLRRATARWW